MAACRFYRDPLRKVYLLCLKTVGMSHAKIDMPPYFLLSSIIVGVSELGTSVDKKFQTLAPS